MGISKEILKYLDSQRVGVLAVEMLDGSPHGATVHFAHTNDPLVFYFETSPEYRKAEPLHKNGKARATFVVGTSEEKPVRPLQLDGMVRVLKENEKEIFNKVYLA